jgi:membrane protein
MGLLSRKNREQQEAPADRAPDSGRSDEDQNGQSERGQDGRSEQGQGGGSGNALADKPTALPARSWSGVLVRTFKGFQRDNLGDLAAALTYYGILAMFPALIALVAIVGLVGHSATQTLISNLDKLAPSSARSIFTGAIHGLQHSGGTAGVVFVVGLAGALWSASSYISAFMRASNSVYGIEEGRPIYKTIPLRLVVTLVLVLLLAISSLAVVVSGGLAVQVGKLIGVGGTAVSVWDIAKWPVLLLIVSVMISILHWAAPNVKHPGFRWLTPGGIFAVLVWVLASALFALYVANFSSYNKTYGAIAGVIIFLVWLWLSNVAILLGVELNSELYRGRELAAGKDAKREPFVEPRQAPKTAS